MMTLPDWFIVVWIFSAPLLGAAAVEALLNWLFYVPGKRRPLPSEVDGVHILYEWLEEAA